MRYRKKILEKPRSLLIHSIFKVFSSSVPFLALFSLMRAYEIGWHYYFLGALLLSIFMLLAFLFRNYINMKWKAGIIVFVSMFVAITSIFYFGFMGVGFLYAFFALVFISILFSKKQTIILGGFLIGALLVISMLYMLGLISVSIQDVGTYTNSWSAWLLADAVIIITASMMLLIIVSNKILIHEIFNHLEKKNRQLADNAQKAEKIANSDSLTGLHNRRSFLSLIESEIFAQRVDRMLGVMCIDIENFAMVNDRYGFEIGDLLLKEFSIRLENISERYQSARMNGDEFLLVVPRLVNAKLLNKIYTFLVATLEKSYFVLEHKIDIKINVGAAIYPKDANKAISLINASKLAMDRAKRRKDEKFCLYGSSLEVALKRKNHIEKSITDALKNDEFKLCFQPIVKSKTHEVVGQEVLMRWKSPVLGVIKTEEYIQVAEFSGQIVEIDFWVIQRVFKEVSTSPLFTNAEVNINVSAHTLMCSDFIERFIELKERYQIINNSQITIEITEHALAEGNMVIENLKKIHDHGFKVSLDDFGTGYSSLNALSLLLIDQVKIDKTFIADIFFNKKSILLLESILMMLDKLSLNIVIEGVEDEAQLQELEKFNYPLRLQGYYFAKPESEPLWAVDVEKIKAT